MISAAACRRDGEDNGAIEVGQAGDPDELPNQVEDVIYQKDGIEARYPELVSDGSEEQLRVWNEMIVSDFNKILQIYSFRPFPEPTPPPAASVPTILKLDYEMKLNSSRYLSIFYVAAFNSPYSAHPSGLVYTTNIDKEEDRRLKLSDIIKLNQDFVKNFRTWDFVAREKGDTEFNRAVGDYITNISDEDLLMGFEASDIIGSGNLYDIFVYLTPKQLGISMGVPNYLGDHIEFERDYSQLKDFLTPEFQIPSE